MGTWRRRAGKVSAINWKLWIMWGRRRRSKEQRRRILNKWEIETRWRHRSTDRHRHYSHSIEEGRKTGSTAKLATSGPGSIREKPPHKRSVTESKTGNQNTHHRAISPAVEKSHSSVITMSRHEFQWLELYVVLSCINKENSNLENSNIRLGSLLCKPYH